MPIQDAGLHACLRTPGIHFVHKGREIYIPRKMRISLITKDHFL